jgi:F-type H+-transporting ATPase subunit epsilon
MSEATFQLDIVSAEQALFSGPVQRISVSGELGDLGIEPGHTPLLSPLKPGHVILQHAAGEQEQFYVSGGLLEVQAETVTILADTCLRGDELDQSAAEAAKEAAQQKLSDSSSNADYSQALAELAQAAAQLRMIQSLRKGRID